MQTSELCQFIAQLTLANFVAVAFIAWSLLTIVVTPRRPQGEFHKEAVSNCFWPLTIGTFLWAMSYAMKTWYAYHLPCVLAWPDWPPSGRRFIYAFDGLSSWYQFVAGSAYFRLEHRIYTNLVDRRDHPLPIMRFFRHLLGSQRGVMFVRVAAFAAIVVSVAVPDQVLASWTSDILSFVGIFVLGVGVLYALTLEVVDGSSVLLGGSIIAYAFLQLTQESQSPIWDVWSRVIAFILKVLLLAALLGFAEMVKNVDRVRQEERKASAKRQREEREASAKREIEYCAWLKSIHVELGEILYRIMGMAKRLQSQPPDCDNSLGAIVTLAFEGKRYIANLHRHQAFSMSRPGLESIDACLVALEKAGIKVYKHMESSPYLTQDQLTGLVIIGSEALANVLKHSEAEHVRFHLGFDSQRTLLVVADDGIGLPEGWQEVVAGATANGGSGIRGIYRTARSIGAELEIETSEEGTKLMLTIDHAGDGR